MNKTVKRFFINRGISTEMELNPYLVDAIELIILTDDEVERLAQENFERLQHEPVWSNLHDMYKKCHEFAGGALATFLIGHIGSAEALCRTSVESSVNLHYASLGDEVGNILAYFRTYINTERTQNSAWLKSVEKSDYSEEGKEYHRKLISKKEESLDTYEEVLRGSLATINIDYDKHAGSWPNTFDRFAKIGKEVGYRTVYAALCSQSHNDPEDILNSLMGRIVLIEGLDGVIEREKYIFSLIMVLTSIFYFTEATAMYLGKYNMSTTLLPFMKKSLELLNEVESNSSKFIHPPKSYKVA